MLSKTAISPTIPVDDLDRAGHFYEDKLGLDRDQRYPNMPDGILYRVGEADLFIYKTAAKRGENTAASFWVDDLETEMRALRDHGVSFEDYDLPGLKTEEGIAEVDGVKSAWFKDSEGNILALTQLR
ncbi:MAG: VOC family protein [Thermoleophilia bacterium]|nr:VOC family protein [Thermoleophilia bacterium]